MNINTQLKKAALEAALKPILKNSRTAPERTVRNILDLILLIRPLSLTAEEKEALYREITVQMSALTPPEFLSWLMQILPL